MYKRINCPYKSDRQRKSATNEGRAEMDFDLGRRHNAFFSKKKRAILLHQLFSDEVCKDYPLIKKILYLGHKLY